MNLIHLGNHFLVWWIDQVGVRSSFQVIDQMYRWSDMYRNDPSETFHTGRLKGAQLPKHLRYLIRWRKLTFREVMSLKIGSLKTTKESVFQMSFMLKSQTPAKLTNVWMEYLRKLRGQDDRTPYKSYDIEYAFCQRAWNITRYQSLGAWNNKRTPTRRHTQTHHAREWFPGWMSKRHATPQGLCLSSSPRDLEIRPTSSDQERLECIENNGGSISTAVEKLSVCNNTHAWRCGRQ